MPAPAASLEELLARVGRDRDRDAFADLFRRFAPRIKGHLQGRGVAPATAEELTQETMLAVWRHAGQFDAARGAASTWVFAIARNALVSHLRREQRPQPEADDPCAAPEDVVPPDDQYAQAERDRLIAHALAQLPVEQQQTLRSAYWGDRSLSEVADDHAVPVGTVKTRVRLAMQKLRDVFGGKQRP